MKSSQTTLPALIIVSFIFLSPQLEKFLFAHGVANKTSAQFLAGAFLAALILILCFVRWTFGDVVAVSKVEWQKWDEVRRVGQ